MLQHKPKVRALQPLQLVDFTGKKKKKQKHFDISTTLTIHHLCGAAAGARTDTQTGCCARRRFHWLHQSLHSHLNIYTHTHTYFHVWMYMYLKPTALLSGSSFLALFLCLFAKALPFLPCSWAVVSEAADGPISSQNHSGAFLFSASAEIDVPICFHRGKGIIWFLFLSLKVKVFTANAEQMHSVNHLKRSPEKKREICWRKVPGEPVGTCKTWHTWTAMSWMLLLYLVS